MNQSTSVDRDVSSDVHTIRLIRARVEQPSDDKKFWRVCCDVEIVEGLGEVVVLKNMYAFPNGTFSNEITFHTPTFLPDKFRQASQFLMRHISIDQGLDNDTYLERVLPLRREIQKIWINRNPLARISEILDIYDDPLNNQILYADIKVERDSGDFLLFKKLIFVQDFSISLVSFKSTYRLIDLQSFLLIFGACHRQELVFRKAMKPVIQEICQVGNGFIHLEMLDKEIDEFKAIGRTYYSQSQAKRDYVKLSQIGLLNLRLTRFEIE